MKIMLWSSLVLVFIVFPSSGLIPRSAVFTGKPNLFFTDSSAAAAPSSHAYDSKLFYKPRQQSDDDYSTTISRSKTMKSLKRLLDRFDTIQSAGLPSSTRVSGLWGKIGKIHDPKTYMVLALAAGFRMKWCFRSMYYWFAVAFLIKWYRAKYVFKIPVWDRQPNWNNVITSKEQEKDLKAYTCLKCGSTLFIAKSREFFFQGQTGLAGLGCFACGVKGEENFVMDRDRIVEDVADMDDYFDYEKPLDFVSRAEKRKLLKETRGDEEKANQLLIERTNAEAGVSSTESKDENGVLDVVGDDQVENSGDGDDDDATTETPAEEDQQSIKEDVTTESSKPTQPVSSPKLSKTKSKVQPKPSPPPPDDDDLDVLEMDF